MAKKDHYEVLGVSKNATEQEIKSSFRKLSRKYHPDMQSGKSDAEKKEAEDKFKEIAAAYEVLSDKDKRSHYDQFGDDSNSGFSSMDMNEFMSRHAGMFSSMFSDFGFGGFGSPFGFGQKTQRNSNFNPNRPENGDDVFVNVNLSFKESVFGCEKEMNFQKSVSCSECNGTGIEKNSTPETCSECHGSGMLTRQSRTPFGMSIVQSPCPHCQGRGMKIKTCSKCNGSKRQYSNEKLSIKIPAGIENGQRLRVAGKGQCGVCGGQNGNLYVLVKAQSSEIFERHGLDLFTTVYISPITAMLGGKIEVPTLTKFNKIEISPGTQDGTIVKVKNAGIKTSTSTGNLNIIIKIETPTNLDSKSQKLLNELKELMTDKNLQKSVNQRKIAEKFYE